MAAGGRSELMDTDALRAMHRFNTWANAGIRAGLERAAEADLRRPLGLWFGSAFDILAHLVAGEQVWLARLRDGQTPDRLATAADFPTTAALVGRWRRLDQDWEAYVASLSDTALLEEVRWISQAGEPFTHVRWQLVMHVPFHSSEHRAHAATALTLLGVRHGPQDFHLQ